MTRGRPGITADAGIGRRLPANCARAPSMPRVGPAMKPTPAASGDASPISTIETMSQASAEQREGGMETNRFAGLTRTLAKVGTPRRTVAGARKRGEEVTDESGSV
jgi:hypothetical protein